MSDASTSATQQQTAGTTATSRSTNKNNVAIIIVACLGGFLFIVALLLVLVPYVRRQAARRQANKSKASTSSGSNSTTTVHNRTVSADASVPLLEPDPNTSTEYSRFRSTTAQSNVETLPSAPHTPGAYSLNPLPRRFAPTFKPSLVRPSSPDLEPGLSRPVLSSPQPPLRHARTRIARVPMDTLPEDAPTDISTQRGPSPTTSDDSHAPAPTSWLHIPKAQGMPLIGAFRGSISSLASGASSSLPTMQHYPSISQNLKSASASASTRSSQTFYTVASDGPTASHDAGPPPSEHGELLQSAAPAWLKPSGVGKRTPQVHQQNSSEGFHASRQASMVYSQKSSTMSGPQSGGHGRPQSGTVASGSSLSLYTDARSQLGSGEDGRWNGSVGGSSTGAPGRHS